MTTWKIINILFHWTAIERKRDSEQSEMLCMAVWSIHYKSLIKLFIRIFFYIKNAWASDKITQECSSGYEMHMGDN